MKRIRFTKRTVFETFGPGHPDNPVFEEGQEEALRNDQADRWLNRGRAELLEDLGPDELTIEGVPQAVIEEVREAVAERQQDETEALVEDLSDAREKLDAAIDE